MYKNIIIISKGIKMKKVTSEDQLREFKPEISWKRSFWFLLLTTILVVLDQVSKIWAANSEALQNGGKIEIIPGFFQFIYTLNSGAAFSFLNNKEWGIYFLTGVSIITAIVFLILLFKYSAWPAIFPVAISVLLAGTVGNLIDRVRLGAVIDFLDFYYKGWHFPTFNVADACITVSAVVLFFYVMFKYDKDLENYNLKIQNNVRTSSEDSITLQ